MQGCLAQHASCLAARAAAAAEDEEEEQQAVCCEAPATGHTAHTCASMCQLLAGSVRGLASAPLASAALLLCAQEQEAQNSTHTIIFPQQAADDDENPPVHSMYVSSHGSFAPGVLLFDVWHWLQRSSAVNTTVLMH
jgi:hypothetical protein